MNSESLERARLALEGLSVGDAFGERFFTHPDLVGSLIAQRALPGGVWSYTDDTEMALAIYGVLAERGRIDQDALARAFADRYRRDPHRGYGGTAHEILARIALGEPWSVVSKSVFEGQGSMGNGGAMRAAPIGAYFAGDLSRVAEEARASAEVTHGHQEGQAGAIAIAVAAAWAWTNRSSPDPDALFDAVLEHVPSSATRAGIAKAAELDPRSTVETAAATLGNGSRVISEDTVPFSLWCAARHLRDYREALWATVAGLGDRDTTCAIVGGIVGLMSAIPPEWIEQREPLQFG